MQVFNFLAYIDPGTGSLIIQSLIGAAAGIAVFGRRALISIKQKFGRGKSTEPTGLKSEAAAKEQSTKSDDEKH